MPIDQSIHPASMVGLPTRMSRYSVPENWMVATLPSPLRPTTALPLKVVTLPTLSKRDMLNVNTN